MVRLGAILIHIQLGLLVFSLGSCSLPGGMDDMVNEGTPENVGYLLIHADIGPLSPVSVDGTPQSTPSPEVCTQRGLEIYSHDGVSLVERFNFRADCTYERALSPGSYVIKMPANTVEISKRLPMTVEVSAGETSEVTVAIDTGIR